MTDNHDQSDAVVPLPGGKAIPVELTTETDTWNVMPGVEIRATAAALANMRVLDWVTLTVKSGRKHYEREIKPAQADSVSVGTADQSRGALGGELVAGLGIELQSAGGAPGRERTAVNFYPEDLTAATLEVLLPMFCFDEPVTVRPGQLVGVLKDR